MQFVRRQAHAGAAIADPLADALTALGCACTGEAAADVDRFLGLQAMFPPDLAAAPAFRAALENAYAALGAGQPEPLLAL
jgi:fructuronate reductase